MSNDEWDDINAEVDEMLIATQTKNIVLEPETVELELDLPKPISDAELKRLASIAARAKEREALDKERQERANQKAAEKAAKQKAEQELREKQNKINDARSPFDKFVFQFIENRRLELIKKNGGKGNGFKSGRDKNGNPSNGTELEKAMQDAHAAWRAMNKL